MSGDCCLRRTIWVAAAMACLGVSGAAGEDRNPQPATPAVPAPAAPVMPPAASPATVPAPLAPDLLQLLDRVSRLERDLRDLRRDQGLVPAQKQDQRVVLVVETAYLGSVYYGSPTNMRFLALKILALNLTPQPVALKRDDVQLLVDGQAHPVKKATQHQYHAFQINQQSIQLRNLQLLTELNLAPGGTGSTWLLFPEVPPGNHIPRLVLQAKCGEHQLSLDLNATQRDALNLTSERIGPRGCLGLLTIGGTLNTINAGALVDELDRLSADKVVRVVIRWSDTAAPLEHQLLNWLQNSANTAGRSQVAEGPFPTIPVTIRELHLAGAPDSSGTPTGQVADDWLAGLNQRVHKSDVVAVLTALQSAYESTPRDELFQTIRVGKRLERAAALAGGGGRLESDKLPVILALADDADPVLQQAALTALSHYGEPAAVAKLCEYVKKNIDPLSGTAIASLAASRYAAAHQALLEVLNNEPPASKKNIVKVLARYPRPVWSDAIYQFAKDPRSGLNQDAMLALVQVGHPQLLSILSEAVHAKDTVLQQQAFLLLSQRNDAESEAVALQYTLDELKNAPPTSPMLTFIGRIKDKRTLPLLFAQFDRTQNKVELIRTLSMIGDQDTTKLLVDKYPSLQKSEKGEVLRALHRLKSPKFRELAAAAIISPDSELIGPAVQGLQEDGDPDSIALMVQALEKSPTTYAWSYLCNALAQAGTPEARAALAKARDSGSAEKRAFAINALTVLRSRSPGNTYVTQAQHPKRQEKWDEVVELYSLAIQLDPQLPDAFAERANAYLMLHKLAEARADFDRAVELDPYNAQAITGQCLVLVLDQGKYEDAIKRLEEARAKFPNSALFAYNAACVYGRSIEYLNKHPEIEQKDKQIAQYTDLALNDLKKSVEWGFQDLDWMKRDPDLQPFSQNAEFQKLIAGNGAPPGKPAKNQQRVRPNL